MITGHFERNLASFEFAIIYMRVRSKPWGNIGGLYRSGRNKKWVEYETGRIWKGGLEKREGHHASNISWKSLSSFYVPFTEYFAHLPPTSPRWDWRIFSTSAECTRQSTPFNRSRGYIWKNRNGDFRRFGISSICRDLFHYNVATAACGHFVKKKKEKKAKESLKRGKWNKKADSFTAGEAAWCIPSIH